MPKVISPAATGWSIKLKNKRVFGGIGEDAVYLFVLSYERLGEESEQRIVTTTIALTREALEATADLCQKLLALSEEEIAGMTPNNAQTGEMEEK